MPPSYPDLREQILSQHFARIPFVIDENQLRDLIQKMMAFFALPEEVKKRFSYQLNPNGRGNEIGYWTRSRAAGNQDNRGYFQYNDYGDERFRAEGQDCPELIAFMDAIRPLYLQAEAALKEVLRAFDLEFPGIYNWIFPADRKPFLFLRLLAYEYMDTGDFLASGHYDRGTCTLAIAESAPGLRIGATPEDVHEVSHDRQSALFFPALTFHDKTASEFVPSWHDVIQKQEHGFNQTTARWAIVLFADSSEQRNISWDEAHTPQY